MNVPDFRHVNQRPFGVEVGVEVELKKLLQVSYWLLTYNILYTLVSCTNRCALRKHSNADGVLVFGAK